MMHACEVSKIAQSRAVRIEISRSLSVMVAQCLVLMCAELHAEAYAKIVASRRSVTSTPDGEQVDVHGLHVDEAIDFVSRRIDGTLACTLLGSPLFSAGLFVDIKRKLALGAGSASRGRSGPFMLDIVCGTGHHSVKGG